MGEGSALHGSRPNARERRQSCQIGGKVGRPHDGAAARLAQDQPTGSGFIVKRANTQARALGDLLNRIGAIGLDLGGGGLLHSRSSLLASAWADERRGTRMIAEGG